MSLAIRAEGLVKRFGSTRALDGVDLQVETGTIVGVLGPNGAGKTTAVRILATLIRPDAGHATVGGHDVVADALRVRAMIGLTGQYASVDEDLSGAENLYLLGRLLRLSRTSARARARELLVRFELTHVSHRPVGGYSGGMRRRLDLAASLVGRPRVLYLDEPTTGLDPRARTAMWHLVRQLVDDGTTVLLTTQYLDEAEQLADRIAVVDHGRVVAEGPPDTLKRRVGGKTLRLQLATVTDVPSAARVLVGLTGVEPAAWTEPGALTVPLPEAVPLATVARALDEAGITLDELTLRLPSLDHVFLALTREPSSALAAEGSTS